MSTPIDFFFDFSSPYSYIASTQIQALADKHGRGINWNPILLGVIFKSTNGAPLTDMGMKGEYSKRDFLRSATFCGVPYQHPDVFPQNVVNASRATLWLQWKFPVKANAWIHACFKAIFVDNRNLSDPSVLAELAQELDIPPAQLAEGIQDASIKDGLKARNDLALARGVFGAPFFFVDGEPFWGNDRLPQIDRWLGSGPFLPQQP